MKRPLPYARVFLGDLSAEGAAQGFGLLQWGILFRLLTLQHMRGSLPTDLAQLRRLVGEDARIEDVKAVADMFFPVAEDRRTRLNAQHAKASGQALRAYEAAVHRGQITAAKAAAKRRAPSGSGNGSTTSSTGSSTKSSTGSNQNQNQNQEPQPDLNYGHPGEKKGSLPPRATRQKAPRVRTADLDGDDDDLPF